MAEHYGEIRAILERTGQPIGANDLWIAAHARSLAGSRFNMKQTTRFAWCFSTQYYCFIARGGKMSYALMRLPLVRQAPRLETSTLTF